jgi:gamma-glutamylcyclotransferase (GGCT)/AIG2-like uncharacterized protein YtfP
LGREVPSTFGCLEGYGQSSVTTANGTYPALIRKAQVPTIDGLVLEIAATDLPLLDRYEEEEATARKRYDRIREGLVDGREVWLYVKK